MHLQDKISQLELVDSDLVGGLIDYTFYKSNRKNFFNYVFSMSLHEVTDLKTFDKLLEDYHFLLEEHAQYTPKINKFVSGGVKILGNTQTSKKMVKFLDYMLPKDITIIVSKPWEIPNFFVKSTVSQLPIEHIIVRVNDENDAAKFIDQLLNISDLSAVHHLVESGGIAEFLYFPGMYDKSKK